MLSMLLQLLAKQFIKRFKHVEQGPEAWLVGVVVTAAVFTWQEVCLQAAAGSKKCKFSSFYIFSFLGHLFCQVWILLMKII